MDPEGRLSRCQGAVLVTFLKKRNLFSLAQARVFLLYHKNYNPIVDDQMKHVQKTIDIQDKYIEIIFH